MYNKTCIIISGPTCSGKTPLAVSLASRLDTAIISADSRQCYRELNIGVARPSQDDLNKVPHYFISSHSIQNPVTAVTFEQYAMEKAEMLFETNNVIVMAGGTGLYIDAFKNGLDDIPAIKPETRESVRNDYLLYGTTWLQEQLKASDVQYSLEGDMNNPQRMMRALEVMQDTGNSILQYHNKNKKQRKFEIVQVGVEMDRDVLYKRINKRVDVMMEDGLLEEAQHLLPHRHLNALQTVGYQELFNFFTGMYSLDRAVELIKQHTRHYAKRQLTWFRKNEDITWHTPGEIENFVIKKMSGN